MPTTTAPRTPLAGEARPRTSRGPILLATDARAVTDATAITARGIADRLGERVEVLAVLEPMPDYTVGSEVPALPPDFETARRAELQAAVCHRLEPVLGSRERWDLDIRYGTPARVIADVARARRARLIVVGSGGHRMVDRLLGEEISLQVVRHASTPVLAVAPQQVGPLHRAVVGMDFSAASIEAARTALRLLEPRPDRSGLLDGSVDAPPLVTLLHVQSVLDSTPPLLASWSNEYHASVETMFARVRDLLAPDVPAGVTIATRIRAGGIADCLRRTAEETDAELVAVGTHGPGWVERLFVGCVATSTLREAGRTVLVAPAPRAAERVRLELRIAGRLALARPDDWSGALDVFTRRNANRRARLEISGTGLDGLEVAVESYRFMGAAYDPRDRRLEIMLGDPQDRTRHVTHGIPHVRAIELIAEDERRDRALLVEVEDGDSVLTFAD
ncbi:MAG: universal stress protein [Gemmatirosa sp.]